MPVLEQERPIATYGIGNPLPLCELGPDDYKTGAYLRGQELHKAGKGPIKDGAFVQIMGLDAGGKEVAFLSRDLVWDGESPIERFGEALVGEILGRPIEASWYGPHQFTVSLEGDLDPEEIATRLVTVPPKVYAKHMRKLLGAALIDQEIYERDFLTGPDAKVKKFVDILYGRTSGQVRAFQPGDGTRGFVAGYEQTPEDDLSAINLDGNRQTMTDLTHTELMDQDMMRSLLDTKKFFQGVKGVVRIQARFSFDISRLCCVYATIAQSEANLVQNDEFMKKTENIRTNSLKISGLDSSVPVIYKQKEICSSCKKAQESCQCSSLATN